MDLSETQRFFSACSGQVTAHLSVNGNRTRNIVPPELVDSIDQIRESLTTPDTAADMAAERTAARRAHAALLAHAMANGDLAALQQARATVERCRDAVVLPS